jgi:hypothetical protein
VLERYNWGECSFKSLFIEVLQGHSAPYSATSIYNDIHFKHSITIIAHGYATCVACKLGTLRCIQEYTIISPISSKVLWIINNYLMLLLLFFNFWNVILDRWSKDNFKFIYKNLLFYKIQVSNLSTSDIWR